MQVEHASSPQTDECLLEHWRAGDRRAGSALLARHLGTLRTFFGRRVVGPDSEDLVQETMSRITRAIRGFESRSSFHTYLMSIAYNTLNDHFRRGYRRISVEVLDDGCVGEPASAEHYLLELERHGLALACVRGLSPELRELLERFYWGDTSARELGTERGIPAGTVRRRLFEARGSLREAYEQATRDGGGPGVEPEQLRSFISSGTT